MARSKEFDEKAVLRKAMELFWEQDEISFQHALTEEKFVHLHREQHLLPFSIHRLILLC